MSDIIGDLEQMDAAPPPDQKPPAAQAPPKPADKPTGEVNPPAKKPDEEPQPKPPEEPEPGKPVKASELRPAYDKLKKRVQTELEPELNKLRARVQELEQQPPEEGGPVQERVKALEARNAQLEQHMAFLDYTQSGEFIKNYQEPYRAAWNEAVAEFRELKVKVQEGEDEVGDPIIKIRPADENDLLRLANMELSDMDAAAQEMFGASASRAISHIQNIRRLSRAQQKAVQDAKVKSAERLKEKSSAFQDQAKKLGEAWGTVNKALEERFPKAYKVEENDPEDKVGFTKGFALADLLFLGEQSLSPEAIEALPASFKETIKAKKPLTEMQKVQLHALARLKMANHDRKTIALKKAAARIKELEEALAAYEKSEPGGRAAAPRAGGAGGKGWEEEVAEELQALDKKG